MTETYEPPTTHVIPAKAGIYPAVSKLSKRRPLSRRLQNSTQYDRVRRTTTKTRARTRARQRRSVFFLSARVAPESQRIRRIAWSCRPLSIMPIHQTEPALDMPATQW